MYLTAREAADMLGVNLGTLYAYVSRKRIRTQPVPGARARLYWREDIERLMRGAAGVAHDVLVPQTAITLITREGPFYRGQSAVALAEAGTFEEACGVLWGEPGRGAWAPCRFRRSPLYDDVLKGLAGATTQQKIIALLPIMQQANPLAYDLSAEAYCRSGAEMIRWLASLIGGRHHAPSNDPIHLRLAETLGLSPVHADLVRRILVISADHELDPSTYAVRAVANTGVGVHQVALAGFACAAGRRLPFGRSEALTAMLDEIVASAEPEEPILRRVREGEPLHGFDTGIYPDGDPRAAALFAAMRHAIPDDPEFRRLERAVAFAEETLERKAAIAIPVSFVARKIGVTGPDSPIFRLARIGGWIAHAIEQFHRQPLVRPRTSYVGPLPERGG